MREDVKEELAKKFAEMNNEELTISLSLYIQIIQNGDESVKETLKLLYAERQKRLFGES